MEKVIGMLKAFGAPVSYIAAAPQGGGRTFTSASFRQGVVSMGTELGGGGLVTPRSLKVAEDGMRRVLAHIGLLQGPVPAPTPTRLTEIGGDDYYVYASDGGLFEPLVDLGDEVKKGQPAARIHFHHTPWREPEIAALQARRPGPVQARAGALRARRLPVPSGDGCRRLELDEFGLLRRPDRSAKRVVEGPSRHDLRPVVEARSLHSASLRSGRRGPCA